MIIAVNPTITKQSYNNMENWISRIQDKRVLL